MTDSQGPTTVASLQDVPLREVWADEARDFTPWLAANPEHLGKAIQMDLELEGAEVAVGPFSADVVLRDSNSAQLVVVENFLESTDHDHVGKLITYAAGLEADWAVLVAKSFREEHRSALNWLNSISGEGSGFFGIEVHAVRIGDSQPAVRLDVVVEPDNFSRRARSGGKVISEANARYAEWWGEFLPAFHQAHPGWSNARATPAANWMNFPSGRSGAKYVLSFSSPPGSSDYSLRAEVYLEDGATAYPLFEAHRAQIQAASEHELSWEPLEASRASRIATYLHPADPADRDSWPLYRDWAVDTLGHLRNLFSERIKNLP